MTILQLDLFGGMQEQKKGLQRVEENDARFLALMRKRARQIAELKGQVTTDDLRYYGACWNLKPVSPHSWGAIFKGEDWVCVGRQASKWKSNHGRHIRVWALKEHP